MVRSVLILLVLISAIPLYGQKKKNDDGIPTIKQQYQRFSIFAYSDGRYVHQETHDVWTDTFIETKPKVQLVFLPGLGNRQSCNYDISECVFLKNDDGIQLITIPINCSSLDGTEEKRVLRIHHIMENRKSDYIYSLGYLEQKDLVLFHNYSDSELGHLLSKDLIRFE